MEIYYDHRKVIVKATGSKIKGLYTTIEAVRLNVTLY